MRYVCGGGDDTPTVLSLCRWSDLEGSVSLLGSYVARCPGPDGLHVFPYIGKLSLGKVGNFAPFGAHGRLAWTGPFRQCRCLRTVGFWQRDWGGFQSGGGSAERGRIGRGPAVDGA